MWKHKADPPTLKFRHMTGDGGCVYSVWNYFLLFISPFFLFVCPSPPTPFWFLSSRCLCVFAPLLELAGYCAAVQGAEIRLAAGWMAETCCEQSVTGS